MCIFILFMSPNLCMNRISTFPHELDGEMVTHFASIMISACHGCLNVEYGNGNLFFQVKGLMHQAIFEL